MSRKYEYACLFIVFCLGLAVRFYISTVFYGTSGDEYANIYLTRNTFNSGFIHYPDQFMWFYYFLSASLLFILKNAFIATKIVTISFGSASIIVIYLLVKKIFDKKIAILTTFLLFIHPEFLIISSTPLREPVYAFFVFLAILLLVNDWIVTGIIAVSMAFMTRMEALWINMPAYIGGIIAKKKYIMILFAVVAFAFSVISMNMVGNEPFGYIKEIIEEQNEVHPLDFLNAGSLFYRVVILPVLKILQYIFALVGVNIIFAMIGAYYLIKDIWKNKEALIFSIFFIFNLFFWFLYIVLYKGVVNENYRYLYILIPFILTLISTGFINIYIKVSVKRKAEVVFLFVLFLMTSYPVYFLLHGKEYIMRSICNKSIVETTEWVEDNILSVPGTRVLTYGIPFFYMNRLGQEYELVKLYDVAGDKNLKKELRNNYNELLSYIDKNGIDFIVWSKNDITCRDVLPYLEEGSMLENSLGRLTPIKRDDTGVVIYEYARKK